MSLENLGDKEYIYEPAGHGDVCISHAIILTELKVVTDRKFVAYVSKEADAKELVKALNEHNGY